MLFQSKWGPYRHPLCTGYKILTNATESVRSVGRTDGGRSVGTVGRDGRSVGRTVGTVGRSGRVRNLNTLLGDLNLRWGLGLVLRALD